MPDETVDTTPEVTEEATPEATPEAMPDATPEVTPDATVDATPEVTEEATSDATPEATPEPVITGFEPATYTLTVEYGATLEALGLPAEVTALLSNGLGGTAYIQEHENPLKTVYTF